MRYENSVTVLALARKLASSSEGMTLDEMCAVTGDKRRTTERVRDAVKELFPQMEELIDGSSKRFRIPGGLDGFFQAPSKDELLELAKAVEELRSQGATSRAHDLSSLLDKIRAAMKRPLLRKFDPDIEALLQAELIAVQAGPRPVEDRGVLLAIREAVLGGKALRFVYDGGSRPGAIRDVGPLGIIFGRMNYLIATDLGMAKPKSWRMDRIQNLAVLDQPAPAPSGFNLADFAKSSFGYFESTPEDVVLHVLPHGIDDGFDNWRFHPDQRVERLSGGGALVRFRASGMLELAWHLFTWGDKVEIVAPVSLRQTLTTELRVALSRHEEPLRYSLTEPSE